MIGLFVNSLIDFRKTYKKYIVFEFIYMLITSFIFVPLISYIFNRLLIAVGSSLLLNRDVFKIVLDYRGIIGLLIMAIIAVIAVFVEFGVLIIISQKKFFAKDILISESVFTVLKITPRILGLGILHLIFILLFLIPLIDSPLSPTLIGGIDIPLFIKEVMFEVNIFYIIYVIAFLAFIYLLLRWVFTLHYIIIEGKSTRDAIRCSIELTRDNRIIILLKLFLLNIVFFIIGFIVISSIAFIPALADLNISYLFENYLITLSSFVTFIFTLLLTPINIIFLTRLYYQVKVKKGNELEDQLKIYTNQMLRKVDMKISRLYRKRKNMIIIVIAVYLIGAIFFTYTVNDSIIYIGRNVLIAGHRGDPINAPENSLSSIRASLEQGVDFIEIDVQKTKDGIVVLNHDIDLMRVAGVPFRVEELTYEEILKLDIGTQFSEEFAGEKVPTLQEILMEARGRSKLIVEIKPYGSSKALAQSVMEVIETNNMVDECYIQSFDYSILEEVRNINSDIKIGQIMYFALGNLSTLDIDFYTVEKGMLSKNFIRRARKDEREVWVWTVNEEKMIKEVLKYDIDGIITDYADRVQEIIGMNFNAM